jgi:hypothetical protein
VNFSTLRLTAPLPGWRPETPQCRPRHPKASGCYPTSTPTRSAAEPRELLFPGRAAERALTPSGQAGNFPVLLIGGTVAGVWHQHRSGRKLDITVEPFDRLTAMQRCELDDQVERIGKFLEGKAHLTIGTVTTGGHA